MRFLNYRNGVFVRILAIAILVSIWVFFSKPELSYIKPTIDINNKDVKEEDIKLSAEEKKAELKRVDGSIMPSMPDLEAKQELGRASWKYFHTLLARFPDTPTDEERDKLSVFINLFAELYPCGECSYHLQKMIKKYPVQTSSRTSASLWGCHIHNVVNKHLKKPEYDCSTILEDYDCGCGDDEKNIKLNKVSINKEEKQLG
ncbi:hypothetical protein TPHA_0B01430 [Tetrapisispora phaffii CBS 4417]|uniref:Sulfhydryl oxidase n=1 Tax=Tetrapisispora phaffii (strain ATCC 24235 / CBS 4417 / NBRC 1672 / NRRL Y-8282 / UCD 70-5) TaxID=1071381 RepID=G8BP85_TETPH|nr:hypothetical protein TPHA_0B01430 [Tetrapisispora phaffii CBS 4417]CCE61816.1 hypothetical protein TPHA_0B01430 [Tetrapisispora phaffii CBS 4417]